MTRAYQEYQHLVRNKCWKPARLGLALRSVVGVRVVAFVCGFDTFSSHIVRKAAALAWY